MDPPPHLKGRLLTQVAKCHYSYAPIGFVNLSSCLNPSPSPHPHIVTTYQLIIIWHPLSLSIHLTTPQSPKNYPPMFGWPPLEWLPKPIRLVGLSHHHRIMSRPCPQMEQRGLNPHPKAQHHSQVYPTYGPSPCHPRNMHSLMGQLLSKQLLNDEIVGCLPLNFDANGV